MDNNTKKLLVISNIFGGAGSMGAILVKCKTPAYPGVLLILADVVAHKYTASDCLVL
jgi:hypothetical protein